MHFRSLMPLTSLAPSPSALAEHWREIKSAGECLVAEVDGNRTRRTGIARPTRFEGGGAHQALRHLR